VRLPHLPELGIVEQQIGQFGPLLDEARARQAGDLALESFGADQPAQPGMPTVTLADDGTPTVSIPDTDPSPDLQVSVLKKGDGAVVQAGADVTAQYQGLIWGSKKIFDQSWGKNGPVPFSTAAGATIPGFASAIVGQTVGSQVIVSIPPAQGYGDKGNQGAGIAPTDTLVFVIDILATS
jgi:peptidylprolyl isomerase